METTLNNKFFDFEKAKVQTLPSINWREPTRRTTSTASRYGAFTTMIC